MAGRAETERSGAGLIGAKPPAFSRNFLLSRCLLFQGIRLETQLEMILDPLEGGNKAGSLQEQLKMIAMERSA